MKYINLQYEIENIDIFQYESKALRAYTDLNDKNLSPMKSWVDVKNINSCEDIKYIKSLSNEVRENSKVLLVIGIGGSFLGAKAGIDFLSNYYRNNDDFEVIFVGNSLSEKYLDDTIKYIKDKDFYINVISKSGTTLEPSIAFNIFRKICEDRYKEESKKRIIVTTSKNTGLLIEIAKNNDYRTLYINDFIGGRYSVLTPVGLFPISCMGFDISKIIDGAVITENDINNTDYKNNPAFHYAVLRNILYRQGKDIEVFSTINPNMHYFLEWLKQLFAESECKNNGGIFPASLILTTDLHSMGQLMQQGKRNIFETFITVENDCSTNLRINQSITDIDKLNYISDKTINDVNIIAKNATKEAHKVGGVPIIEISIKEQNEFTLGAFFYFFEFSCAICCYMSSVDPFNQPGVEKYKQNIKNILG